MAKRRAAPFPESPGLEAPTDDPVPRVVPQVIVTLDHLFERGKTALIFDSVQDPALGRWAPPSPDLNGTSLPDPFRFNLSAVVLTREITLLDAKNNAKITRRSGFYCSEDLLRQLVRG